jgi:hypothetical protein
VDEKGMKWFTKVWVPSVAGSMIMRSHVRIRSRDCTASYPANDTRPWAFAALNGSHLGCFDQQRWNGGLANQDNWCRVCAVPRRPGPIMFDSTVDSSNGQWPVRGI